MRLVGQLSNPPHPLGIVLAVPPDDLMAATRRPEPPPCKTGRLGNGVVKRAAIKVLAAADGPMRGADIHTAVARLLGYPVSKNSVSWCLAAGTQGKRPCFVRVSYGCYLLAPQT